MHANITAAISDMRAIDKWCYAHPYAPPPPSAVAYVAANKDLLLCLIDHVALMSRSDRAVLQSKHRELDENVLSAEFFSIPRDAVDTAHQVASGNQLTELTDDDVHMIVRTVLYAQYSTPDCPHPLVLSPVRLPE